MSKKLKQSSYFLKLCLGTTVPLILWGWNNKYLFPRMKWNLGWNVKSSNCSKVQRFRRNAEDTSPTAIGRPYFAYYVAKQLYKYRNTLKFQCLCAVTLIIPRSCLLEDIIIYNGLINIYSINYNYARYLNSMPVEFIMRWMICILYM